MATGEGGGCVRKKRSTDGDGKNGPSKRCRIAAASTAEDSETGDDTGDYNINGDDIDDNGDCTGEDLIYYYSDDDAETEVDDANAVEPAEQRYIVLSEDAIRARQEADIAEVAEVLSVPPGFAAVLLRYYKWRAMRVQEEWFSDDRRIRDAVGLPADGGVLAGGKDERRWEQAKASLDRYLYHYERWAANDTSLQMVFKDMADLERKGLEKMSVKVHVPASDLRFLTKAYKQVADCRRVLRWAHAYGYFLEPKRDAIKRNLFDQLQKDANSSLERLHGCAEVERKKLCAGDAADVAERYKSYKKKLQSLTQVTRHYFENLVKAFETKLAEVETAE